MPPRFGDQKPIGVQGKKPWREGSGEGSALSSVTRRALALLLLAAPARAATARFDARDGELGLSVRAAGLLRVRGRFAEFAAVVSEAGLEVRAAPASLLLNLSVYEETLRGPEWFDAQRFPEALLRVPGPLRAGAPGERAGVLTLRGVARPMAVQLLWEEGPGGASVAASGTISRSAYGMVADSFTVSDTVSLSLAVRRQAQ